MSKIWVHRVGRKSLQRALCTAITLYSNHFVQQALFTASMFYIEHFVRATRRRLEIDIWKSGRRLEIDIWKSGRRLEIDIWKSGRRLEIEIWKSGFHLQFKRSNALCCCSCSFSINTKLASVWVETSLAFKSSRIVRGVVTELLYARALLWLPSQLHLQNGRPNEGDSSGSKRLVSRSQTLRKDYASKPRPVARTQTARCKSARCKKCLLYEVQVYNNSQATSFSRYDGSKSSTISYS